MQDYRTLKLLDRFERIFSGFGVDYKIMRRLLQVKLTMDGRRVPTIFSQNAKKENKEKKQSVHKIFMDLCIVWAVFDSICAYGGQLPIPDEPLLWDFHLFRYDLHDFRFLFGFTGYS